MAISIERAEGTQEPEWDNFVRDHPRGTPFHLTAWKRVIEETFDYEPRYLCARDKGKIRGLLPLFLVDTVLTGKVLISSPFAVYGGVLADCDEVREAFGAELRRLAECYRISVSDILGLDFE